MWSSFRRERGREGQKHQCVVASRAPPTGNLGHNPVTCPDWESNLWPFGLQASTQSTEPHQPGLLALFLNGQTPGSLPPLSSCHFLMDFLYILPPFSISGPRTQTSLPNWWRIIITASLWGPRPFTHSITSEDPLDSLLSCLSFGIY